MLLSSAVLLLQIAVMLGISAVCAVPMSYDTLMYVIPLAGVWRDGKSRGATCVASSCLCVLLVVCGFSLNDLCMLSYCLQVFGEITSHADVDYAAIARQACRDIGYTDEALGFDADTAEVKVLVAQQVPEIAQVMLEITGLLFSVSVQLTGSSNTDSKSKQHLIVLFWFLGLIA